MVTLLAVIFICLMVLTSKQNAIFTPIIGRRLKFHRVPSVHCLWLLGRFRMCEILNPIEPLCLLLYLYYGKGGRIRLKYRSVLGKHERKFIPDSLVGPMALAPDKGYLSHGPWLLVIPVSSVGSPDIRNTITDFIAGTCNSDLSLPPPPSTVLLATRPNS